MKLVNQQILHKELLIMRRKEIRKCKNLFTYCFRIGFSVFFWSDMLRVFLLLYEMVKVNDRVINKMTNQQPLLLFLLLFLLLILLLLPPCLSCRCFCYCLSCWQQADGCWEKWRHLNNLITRLLNYLSGTAWGLTCSYQVKIIFSSLTLNIRSTSLNNGD